MTTIDYFISLNSPWTYLGSARFAAMTKKAGAVVNVKPARFIEVFAKTGGLPLPKRSPERQAYRLMEIKRWPKHLGIKLNAQPKFFPTDEAPATRLVLAAALQGLDAHALATEIGRAQWELEENHAEAAVQDRAAARAGLDAASIRKAAPDDAALDAIWDRNTADALARGVFGAPSYVFPDGEFFWGQDRLDFVAAKLTGR